MLNNLGVKEKDLKSKNKIIFLDEYDINHPLYFSSYSPLALMDIDIQLDGYFLNYRIHNKKVIKNIKRYIKNLELVKKFKKMEFISIHLRESHLIYSQKIKKRLNTDSLNINYYSDALKRISKISALSGVKNAIVFSDMSGSSDVSILLPQIKILLKDFGFKYFDGDALINSPLDIINIFSFSKSIIISNSTLSWWGAYLSNGKIFSPVMNLWEPELKVPDHWEQIYSGEIKPKTHHGVNLFDTLSLIEKKSNFKIYSFKRLKVLKIYRKLSNIIYKIFKLNLIKKWLKILGITLENNNKTYF